MKPITDEEMKIICQEMVDSLSTLVRSQEDAILIFGFDVARYVNASGIVARADFYGNVMSKVLDINYASGIFREMEQHTEIYKVICKKYGYGDSVSSQGEMWKELLRGEKKFRIKMLYAYLERFGSLVEPFLRRKAREWINVEKKQYFMDNRTTGLKKEWKQYKQQMSHTRQIIENALDIWELQNVDRCTR